MLIHPVLDPILFNKPGGNDIYTLLLCHAEGADAGTTFVDSSRYARTLTANGNVQTDNAQFRFGSTSALFDGSGDYISAADSADWNFGTNPWTIDAWVRWNSIAAQGTIFAHGTNGNNGQRLNTLTNGSLDYEIWAGPNIVNMTTPASTITTGRWYHVAVVRQGGEWRLFVDGRVAASLSGNNSSVADYTNTFRFGHDVPIGVGWAHNGWMDEMRVSTVARWLSNFNPPGRPYQ